MDKEKELYLKWKIAEADAEWFKIADPQMNAFGLMTFHNPNDQELFRMVVLQDKMKEYRKELRKGIGLINYIKYLIWK